MEVLVEAQDGLTGKYRGRGANSAPVSYTHLVENQPVSNNLLRSVR